MDQRMLKHCSKPVCVCMCVRDPRPPQLSSLQAKQNEGRIGFEQRQLTTPFCHLVSPCISVETYNIKCACTWIIACILFNVIKEPRHGLSTTRGILCHPVLAQVTLAGSYFSVNVWHRRLHKKSEYPAKFNLLPVLSTLIFLLHQMECYENFRLVTVNPKPSRRLAYDRSPNGVKTKDITVGAS